MTLANASNFPYSETSIQIRTYVCISLKTEDVFTIDEVTMYEGEWTEKNYAVAGDILDGQLYDLFMNMLDERGVTQGFADNLSEYCSAYEHSRYIKMLEDVQKFVK